MRQNFWPHTVCFYC